MQGAGNPPWPARSKERERVGGSGGCHTWGTEGSWPKPRAAPAGMCRRGGASAMRESRMIEGGVGQWGASARSGRLLS